VVTVSVTHAFISGCSKLYLSLTFYSFRVAYSRCNEPYGVCCRREGGACPVDNQPLDSKDLFPDNFTRREIHELDRKNGQVNEDYFSKMFLTPTYIKNLKDV